MPTRHDPVVPHVVSAPFLAIAKPDGRSDYDFHQRQNPPLRKPDPAGHARDEEQ
jgi:hypothetical protein